MLLFIKFKLNVSFSVLGVMYNVSESSALQHFYKTLDVVDECIRHDVFWFDKGTIQVQMPASFCTLYPKMTAIIDCTEIETERPSTVRGHVLMYSSYKS